MLQYNRSLLRQPQRPPMAQRPTAQRPPAAQPPTQRQRATTTRTAQTADTGMSAPTAETGMSASAAPAAAMTAPAAAAAAATRNSNALAKRGIFPIEDLKGRQTDVGDFLLGQNQSPCIVLRRYIRCGCGCRCCARHRQRNPGCAQCPGCLFSRFCARCLLTLPLELRLACVMVDPPRQRFDQGTRAGILAPCAMNRQDVALVPPRGLSQLHLLWLWIAPTPSGNDPQ